MDSDFPNIQTIIYHHCNVVGKNEKAKLNTQIGNMRGGVTSFIDQEALFSTVMTARTHTHTNTHPHAHTEKQKAEKQRCRFD